MLIRVDLYAHASLKKNLGSYLIVCERIMFKVLMLFGKQ